MTEERRRLRARYDEVAQLYDQARPGYPKALFDDGVSLSGIPRGGKYKGLQNCVATQFWLAGSASVSFSFSPTCWRHMA